MISFHKYNQPIGSTMGWQRKVHTMLKSYYTFILKNGRQLRDHVGKPGGVIFNNKLVIKVRSSVHMLKSPPAWAIDSSTLQEARESGVTVVILLEQENEVIYCAPISQFRKHGQLIDRHPGNRILLPLEYWKVTTQLEML